MIRITASELLVGDELAFYGIRQYVVSIDAAGPDHVTVTTDAGTTATHHMTAPVDIENPDTAPARGGTHDDVTPAAIAAVCRAIDAGIVFRCGHVTRAARVAGFVDYNLHHGWTLHHAGRVLAGVS